MAEPRLPPRVTVRFWAGAKAAAGTAEQQVLAASLAEALDAVRETRDADFTRVLSLCSLVVSEQPLGQRDPGDVVLVDGDVIEVLPPFAGGAGHDRAVTMPSRPTAVAHWRSPLLQLVLAAVLALGAVVGPGALWVAVIAAQLVLVVSWHAALGATDARRGAVVGAVLVAAADVAVMVTDETVSYGPIALVLGVGFLLAVVQQLARRDGRAELTVSLSATVSLAAVGAVGAGWAVNLRLADGQDLTVLAAGAVAAAAIGRLLPRAAGVAGALVAGSSVGAVAGASTSGIGLGLGLAIGLASAVPSALAATLALRGEHRLAGWPAAAAWPILLAPGLVYLVIRVAGT